MIASTSRGVEDDLGQPELPAGHFKVAGGVVEDEPFPGQPAKEVAHGLEPCFCVPMVMARPFSLR